MSKLMPTIIAVIMAIGYCQPPDPGVPCQWPDDYRDGYWRDATGQPIGKAPSEDSAITVWYCTPDAELIQWEETLED